MLWIKQSKIVCVAMVFLCCTRHDAWSQTEPSDAAGELTMQRFRMGRVELERRLGVDVYLSKVCQSGPWAQEIPSLLEDWLRFRAKLDGRVAHRDLLRRATGLVHRGCDDPLVHLATADLLHRDLNAWEANERYRYAIEHLEHKGYPAYWTHYARVRFAEFLESHYLADSALEQIHNAVDDFCRAFSEGEYSDQWRILVYDIDYLFEHSVPSDRQRIFAALEVHKAIDPWVLHMARGYLEFEKGWDARGSGFANTVTDEGWRAFELNLKAAMASLKQAHEEKPEWPEAAEQMIAIAMTGHADPGEDESFWFHRATSAQFDWLPAYVAMRRAMLPRWGGSHEAMFAFGLSCAKTARFDSEVPMQLIETILRIAEDQYENPALFDGDPRVLRRETIWGRDGLYEAAARVLTAYIDRPHAAAEDRHYWQTMLAGIAWRTGHVDECGHHLNLLIDEPNQMALDKLYAFADEIFDDVIKNRSRISDQLNVADGTYWRGAFVQAADAYEQLLNAAAQEGDDILRVAYDRYVVARLMRDFQGDGWVPLTFEPGLPGWRRWRGAWRVDSDRELWGGPGRQGMRLVCAAPFGRRWEMKGLIDLDQRTGGRHANAGVVFGVSGRGKWQAWQSMLLFRNGQMCIGWANGTSDAGTTVKLNRTKEYQYRFHMVYWDGVAQVTIEDQQVFAGKVLASEWCDHGPYVGLGGYSSGPAGFAIYKDLQIRRLAECPPELLAFANEQAVTEELSDAVE